MKCNVIKIPFKNKGSYGYGKSQIDKYSGNAYLFFNQEGIINRQIVQFDKGSLFRPSDNKMTKPTDYYIDDFINPIRTKMRSINSESTKKRIPLNDYELNEINNYCLKHGKKMKRQIDIITGSNSSGAEKNITADRIWTKYNGNYMRFSNSFNRIYSEKEVNWNGDEKEINVFSLEDYITMHGKDNGFNKIIATYNVDLLEEGSELYNSIDFNSLSTSFKDIDFKESTNIIINKYIPTGKVIPTNEKGMVSALRRIQRDLLKVETLKNNYKIDFIGTNSSLDEVECAHILSVKYLKTKQQFLDIANPNNAIFLTKTNHGKLDDRGYYFSIEGVNEIAIRRDDDIIGYIDPSCLNPQRVKFITRAMAQ